MGIFRLLLTLLLLSVPGTALAHASHLTILHFNDLHGHVENAARIATIVKGVEAENRAKGWDTIVLFGGDALSGTVVSSEFKGEAELAFLKAIGTDAMVIGNHEFDYGGERLRGLIGAGGIPILSANIFLKGTKQPYATPSTVIALEEGLRVAVLGLIYAGTPKSTFPAYVAGLTFSDAGSVAKRELPRLRKQSDLVIALTHQGVKADDALAKDVKGFAAVVGGHDHVRPAEYCQEVDAVPVCETPSEGRFVGRIDLDVSGRTPKLEGWKLIPVDAKVPEDPQVAALIAGYERQASAKYDAVIARARTTLANARGQQGPLGTLIAEAMREQSGAEAAFLNSGGIRAAIRKGPITLREVHEVLPFQNRLVILTMTGEELQRAMRSAAGGGSSFPQAAGIELQRDGKKLTGIRINGEPLDPARSYRVATVDFLAAGSGGYESLCKIPAGRVQSTDVLVADAFADYLRKVKVVPMR